MGAFIIKNCSVENGIDYEIITSLNYNFLQTPMVSSISNFMLNNNNNN